MRRTKDGRPLEPYHLRDHASTPNHPFWEGDARQLLSWAADVIESGKCIIDMHRPAAARPASFDANGSPVDESASRVAPSGAQQVILGTHEKSGPFNEKGELRDDWPLDESGFPVVRPDEKSDAVSSIDHHQRTGKRHECDHCDGSGMHVFPFSDVTGACSHCNGTGFSPRASGETDECLRCAGAGKVEAENPDEFATCPDCDGRGAVSENAQ